MSERASLDERRERLQAIAARAESDMAAIGIDRAFIDSLVDTFYARIRNHAELGPIFEAKLSGNWSPHLEKMKRFWASLAFKDGAYGGKPLAAHRPLPGLVPPLFGEWLALFNATLIDIAPSPRAHDWFMTTADRIARSMVVALFEDPNQALAAADSGESNPGEDKPAGLA